MNWSVAAKQLIVLVGAALLIWGAFLPLLGIAIFHDKSFFDVSPTGAIILILLAIVSVALAIVRRFGGLYLTGLLALVLVIYTVGAIQKEKSELESNIRQHVAVVPLKGSLQNIVSSTRLRHGFVLMGLGSLILVGVPLLAPRLKWVRHQSSDLPKPS